MEKKGLINLKNLADECTGYLPYIGGKALGLALINRLALPCPRTWVVTTTLFAAFKKRAAAGAEGENTAGAAFDGERLLNEAAGFIASEIGAELDKLPRLDYAVRSSATVEDAAIQSFAGIFESFLNVSPHELPTAIAQVWLSGLGRRVRAYGGESDSGRDLSRGGDPISWPDMAVVIQPMIDAAYAGVCFSRHPSPQDVRDTGRALVEIVPGAGEQLVRGEVTPLSFVGAFTELATCLDRPWMQGLAASVTALEQYTGGPVDVEFAVDKQDRLWILQQRPVTVVLDSRILGLKEYRKAYKRTLCNLDIEFLIDGCARYLAPYLELSLDLTRWMVMTTNAADGRQELWIHEQLDDAIIRGIAGRIRSESSYLIRLAHRYDRLHRQILDCQAMPWADGRRPIGERLQDFFEFVVPLNAHYYVPMHIIEALSLLLLEDMKKIDPTAAGDDFFKLTTSGVTTLGQDFAGQCRELKKRMVGNLKTMPEHYEDLSAAWQREVDELAAGFGFLNCHLPFEPPYNSREVYEFVKDAVPAGSDPEPAGGGMVPALEQKYAASAGVTETLAALREWLNRRNRQMEYLYFVYAQARPLLLAVGETGGMSLKEVWEGSREGLLNALAPDPVVTKRAYDHSTLCLYHDGRKVCFRDDLRPVFATSPEDGAQLLKGKTVFGSGEITGTVRVAFSPEEICGPEDQSGLGDEDNLIVITGMTTPDFVPALTKKAAALVTDEGGILCHAAIIAREIRLPCIVGTGAATEKLKNGARVILDLDRGEIRSL